MAMVPESLCLPAPSTPNATRSGTFGFSAVGVWCVLASLAAALGGCLFETAFATVFATVPEPLEKRSAGGGGVETVGIARSPTLRTDVQWPARGS
jgi:hypothetical protein